MIKVCLRAAALAAVFAFAAAAPNVAYAQTDAQVAPETPLNRQLARIDISLAAAGQFTSNTSGSTSPNQTVSLRPSSTLGYQIGVRYVARPFVGFEFNYVKARYSENFTFTNIAPGATGSTLVDAQTNVTEYTFGYLVNAPHTYFGIQPFASVGAGSLAFRPTNGGGAGFTPQARAAYYYSVGGEELVYGKHLGLRASFRQVFALAPDFQATYLRDHQRTITSEPTVGIFIRF